MEGDSQQNGNVVSRYIYVLDKRRSSEVDALVNVYLRSDTITDTSDTIELTLVQQIDTLILGAPKAKCFMAGSDSIIFVGTDASAVAAKISLLSSGVSEIRGSTNVQSITADERGYVNVSYLDDSHIDYDPEGNPVADGGETFFRANTRNGFTSNK
jgi:hypothetical protein